MRWVICIIPALILAATLAWADEAGTTSSPDLKSGLQIGLRVGDKVPTFYVRAITGPLKNKSVCYVCRNGDRPVVMVLVRETSPELAKLLKGIDEQVDRHRADGLRSFGVFLAQDSQQLLPKVQTLAFDEKIDLPLTIAAAPADGPAGQSVPPEAAVTVVLYRDQKVTANFVYRTGELTAPEIAKVLAAAGKLAEGE